jgi:hypothetical protein
MAASPFLDSKGWTITSWQTVGEPVLDGIPDNSFQPQSTMLIGLDSSNPDSYGLRWFNQNGELCSMSGLQLQPGGSTLTGDDLPVRFGRKVVSCFLILTLNETRELTGDISMDDLSQRKERRKGILGPVLGPDTGGGTFAATANAGPPFPVGGGATRERSTS